MYPLNLQQFGYTDLHSKARLFENLVLTRLRLLKTFTRSTFLTLATMKLFTTILTLLATSILYVAAYPTSGAPHNFLAARSNALADTLSAASKRDSSLSEFWARSNLSDDDDDDDEDDLPFCDEVEDGDDGDDGEDNDDGGDDEEDCDDDEDVDSDGEDGDDDDDGEDCDEDDGDEMDELV
ncbi:hypothetical protein BDQ17DRAFT_1425968 [Cyathus striatus]|nr:hypothetical protein BDQ17DRAFT_1425968 [Cyathus striatus]